MRRMILLLGVLAVAFSPPALAEGPPDSDRSPGRRQQRRPAGEARRVLAKKVPSIDWEDVPLEDIFEWLENQGRADVIVRWAQLELEGIDPGMPVTLKLTNTTVAKVLAEVFEQISDTEPVLYRGIGNTIKISTRSDFSRKLYTRVYDISDIIMRVRDFRDAPRIDLTRSSSSGGGGGGGGQDENIFADDDDDDDDDEQADLEKRVDDLIAIIEDTIEPDTWMINGGRGTIAAFNNMLVVRNTIEVHAKLGGAFVLKE